MPRQQSLFADAYQLTSDHFPSTRYQGSKRKILSWLWSNLRDIECQTVLDAFGGTGIVSYLFKSAGKQVTYNDYLLFNHHIGKALIENNTVTLSDADIDRLMHVQPGIEYPSVIQDNFEGIYYTDKENQWLDYVVYNIRHLLDNEYKQALAFFALFQACIIKRPYNLFHRANLYMRLAQVERSFGNKTTWDTPFEEHFRQFAHEANQAVFDNDEQNQALHKSVIDTPTGFDLVYLDPPYIKQSGTGVDYRDFYHFLEGMVNYDSWQQQIDFDSKHHRLKRVDSPWHSTDTIQDAFEAVIAHHRNSTLVISYRDDGIPAPETLIAILSAYKPHVKRAELPQQYVLSKRMSHELLLIGTEQK